MDLANGAKGYFLWPPACSGPVHGNSQAAWAGMRRRGSGSPPYPRNADPPIRKSERASASSGTASMATDGRSGCSSVSVWMSRGCAPHSMLACWRTTSGAPACASGRDCRTGSRIGAKRHDRASRRSITLTQAPTTARFGNTIWRRRAGDDRAAFDRLPPAMRQRLAEHAFDAWSVTVLMLWRALFDGGTVWLSALGAPCCGEFLRAVATTCFRGVLCAGPWHHAAAPRGGDLGVALPRWAGAQVRRIVRGHRDGSRKRQSH